MFVLVALMVSRALPGRSGLDAGGPSHGL
jgi:hypothetical protein